MVQYNIGTMGVASSNPFNSYINDAICVFANKEDNNNKLYTNKPLYVVFDYYPHIVTDRFSVNNHKYNIINVIYTKDKTFENKIKQIVKESIKYCNHNKLNINNNIQFDIMNDSSNFIVKINQDGEQYVEIYLKINIKMVEKTDREKARIINSVIQSDIINDIFNDNNSIEITNLTLDDIRLGIYHSFIQNGNNVLLKMDNVFIKLREKDIYKMELFQKKNYE